MSDSENRKGPGTPPTQVSDDCCLKTTVSYDLGPPSSSEASPSSPARSVFQDALHSMFEPTIQPNKRDRVPSPSSLSSSSNVSPPVSPKQNHRPSHKKRHTSTNNTPPRALHTPPKSSVLANQISSRLAPTLIRLPNGSQLHLPTGSACSEIEVDEYLESIPVLRDASAALLSRKRNLTRSNTRDQRLVYIGQGEVGHGTSEFADMMLSDQATTCHILALHSYGPPQVKESHNISSLPLTTVTHLDATHYESCLREMIQQHMFYHGERKPGNSLLGEDANIRMEVHLLGGYKDERETSVGLTKFVMNALARLATEFYHGISMTLVSCAVSCMNGIDKPLGRGLGVDLQTGHAFCVHVVDELLLGPAPLIRSVCTWTGTGGDENDVENGRPLRMVYDATTTGDVYCIQPFRYAPLDELDELLDMSDDEMILYTSTSPEVEADNFVGFVRETLEFMRDVPYQKVFGKRCNRPLIYERHPQTPHAWQRKPKKHK